MSFPFSTVLPENLPSIRGHYEKTSDQLDKKTCTEDAALLLVFVAKISNICWQNSILFVAYVILIS